MDDWTPFGITTPTDPRLPASGQPITMYTLNTTKVGMAIDNLRTFSDVNAHHLQRLRAERQRAVDKLLMFGGITTDRRGSTECDGATSAAPPPATTPTACASATHPAVPDDLQDVGAYQLPWDFQMSGTFLAMPGPSINANYTVTAAIAGRTIVGSTAGGTTIEVNLVEPNTVFLDYRKQLDLRLGKTFRFGRETRIQGFADIFNVFSNT